MQDDYLDVFGNPETFGKQVGGDIIENKKTYLYLQALERCVADDARELRDLYSVRPTNPQSKVDRVRQIFETCGADQQTRDQIGGYTREAFARLDTLTGNPRAKAALRDFGEWLLSRDF